MEEYIAEPFFADEMLRKNREVREALEVLERDVEEGIRRLKELGFNNYQIAFIVSGIKRIPVDEAIELVRKA